MFKKIVSILLCLCFLCGFVTVTSAATTARADKYQIIDILKHLNMLSGDYDDVTIEWSKPITRADYAYYAASILKRGYKGTELHFHDVSRQHWAFSSISALVETGLLEVNEEKKFYPDDNITAEEAISIALRALGYKFGVNESIGLTPIKIAGNLGITKGVSVSGELTFSDAIQLLYNALIANTMEMTTSSGGFGYRASDKTYLEAEYYIGYKEGILEGYDGISISGKTVRDNTALVSGVQYDVGNVDLSNFIGCRIAYIYDFTNYDDSGIILWAEKVNSEDLTLYYGENEVTFDSSNYKLSYYDSNERRRSVQISKTADVVYNGEYITFGIESLLEGKTYSIFDGSVINNMYSVKLIKNSGENEYSKVILSSYQNVVIGAINFVDEGIYDKITKKYLSFDTTDKLEIIDKDNQGVDFSDLKAGDVLSIYKSVSGTRIKAIVSKATVSGQVVSQKSENGYEYITIDGTEYRGAEQGVYLNESIDHPVILYLDVNSHIAYAERSAQHGNLAYLIRIRQNRKDDKLTLRMFKADGNVTDCESASVLRIEQDGVLTKYKDILGAFNAMGGNSFVPSIISYKTDAEGLITHIYFPSKNKKATLRQIYNQVLDSAGKVASEGQEFSSQQYSKITSNIGRFGNNTIVNKDTVMFGIPANPENAGYNDFSMLTIDNIKIDRSYNFYKYALSSEVGYDEIIVFKGYSSQYTYELLVTKMGQCINDDNEVVDYVEGYNGSSYVSVKCDPSFSVAAEGIQKGHYLKYFTNNDGSIKAIDDKLKNAPKSGTSLRASGWAAGYANDVVGDIVKIGYKSGENSEAVFYFDSSIPVLVYNMTEDKARIGSIADIKPYKSAGNACSLVFTSLKNGVPLVYVVYE